MTATHRLEPTGDHDYENPEHGVTVAYSRDRNEKGTKAHESESYSDAMRLNMGQEFAYFFVPWNEDPTTGKWECYEVNKYIDLYESNKQTKPE